MNFLSFRVPTYSVKSSCVSQLFLFSRQQIIVKKLFVIVDAISFLGAAAAQTTSQPVTGNIARQASTESAAGVPNPTQRPYGTMPNARAEFEAGARRGLWTATRRATHSIVNMPVNIHSSIRIRPPKRRWADAMLSSTTTATFARMTAMRARSKRRPALVSASKMTVQIVRRSLASACRSSCRRVRQVARASCILVQANRSTYQGCRDCGHGVC